MCDENTLTEAIFSYREGFITALEITYGVESRLGWWWDGEEGDCCSK